MTQILHCFRKKTKQKGDKLQTVMKRDKFWVLLNLSCPSLKTPKQNRTLIDVPDHTCVYLQVHIHRVAKGLRSKCGCTWLQEVWRWFVRALPACNCLLATYTDCTSGDCCSLRSFWLTEGWECFQSLVTDRTSL